MLLGLLVKPFGGYMTRVFNGERTLLRPVLRPIEVGLYKLCGVREEEEQHWVTYAVAMLFFSVAGFLSLYALQRLQGVLPFNPQGQSAVSPDLAFNTSVSFITNTNWQSYTPESTMSYLVQMAGLTVHNFLSAATGIALAIALIRGFARRSQSTIGNFWVDMTRCTLYVLLPVSIVVGCSSSGRACRRTCTPIPRRPRWRAPSRSSPRARSRRRRRSRCSAPMAAASSTPTPPIRSRTRRR